MIENKINVNNNTNKQQKSTEVKVDSAKQKQDSKADNKVKSVKTAASGNTQKSAAKPQNKQDKSNKSAPTAKNGNQTSSSSRTLPYGGRLRDSTQNEGKKAETVLDKVLDDAIVTEKVRQNVTVGTTKTSDSGFTIR